jgi:hypothetical protein
LTSTVGKPAWAHQHAEGCDRNESSAHAEKKPRVPRASRRASNQQCQLPGPAGSVSAACIMVSIIQQPPLAGQGRIAPTQPAPSWNTASALHHSGTLPICGSTADGDQQQK